MTAPISASLLGKYWYSDPMLIPAVSATRFVDAASYPKRERTRAAASTAESTSERDRDCFGLFLGENGVSLDIGEPDFNASIPEWGYGDKLKARMEIRLQG